jgi:hypothetical protein
MANNVVSNLCRQYLHIPAAMPTLAVTTACNTVVCMYKDATLCVPTFLHVCVCVCVCARARSAPFPLRLLPCF